MGISVEVTGPLVLNSRTIDNAGAGAVASAIPPKGSIAEVTHVGGEGTAELFVPALFY